MERYVLLSTTSERNRVVKATNALESAGIPVIVQHSFNNSQELNKNFRLMVPERYSVSANQVVKPIMLKS